MPPFLLNDGLIYQRIIKLSLYSILPKYQLHAVNDRQAE